MREIDHTIAYEGDYSNDPDDPGGETRWGIAKRYHPDLDIKNLTREQAAHIYLNEYFYPLRCNELSSIRVRWKLFDLGVNLGRGASAKMLQRAVGTDQDGIIGSVTVQATNRLCLSAIGEHLVLARLVEYQVKHYALKIIENPVKIKYLIGWLNRAFDIGEKM